MSIHIPWRESEDAFIKAKAAEGWSSSQIAAELPGRTRNAVIGRIHRQSVERPVKPKVVRPAAAALKASGKAVNHSHPWSGGKARVAALVARKPVPAFRLSADAILPTPLMVKLEALGPNQCKWPIGDPQHEDFGFCGHGRQEGKSYCPHHVSRSVSTWVPGMLRGVEA